MKKLTALLLVALAFSSCRTPFLSTSASIDYSKYSNKDFFITESNSVSFNYTPIASVINTQSSGYEHLVKNGEVQYKNSYNGVKTPRTTKKFVYATIEDTLDDLYNNAIKMGANGIINLKIVSEYANSKTPILIGYSASGMAIKK